MRLYKISYELQCEHWWFRGLEYTSVIEDDARAYGVCDIEDNVTDMENTTRENNDDVCDIGDNVRDTEDKVRDIGDGVKMCLLQKHWF